MINIKQIRQQFPFIVSNPETAYFDNTATALKPISVINAESTYLAKISANPHTSDYDTAYEANRSLDQIRIKTQQFINAKSKNEVIFTSGATYSLNQLAFGLIDLINEGDEIFISSLEHSSDMLPWVVIAKQKKAVIKIIPLNDDITIDADKLASMISEKTKIIAFASVSNTVGALNDVKDIITKVKNVNSNVIVSVDCAQSIGHVKTDVQDWNADAISFSSHKMYGPFGAGVLWAKQSLLEQMKPLVYGGGMSETISLTDMSYELSPIPARFEAGTPNISGIYAFGAAIDFINSIGIDKIHEHEVKLKQYAIKQIKAKKLETIVDFYNLNNDSPILLFNVKGINPQDIASYLAVDYGIDTRSGAHCARRVQDVIDTKISVRASFAIYNTFDEIDRLITGLAKSNHFLDHILG